MLAPQRRVLMLELNEINFDFVRYYCNQGKLSRFADLLNRHRLVITRSETHYEHLEPWIQWVTAHTGLTFAEHRVFRLGDIINTDLDQVWEQLERRGVRVGAVSPMNAKNRLTSPAFFIPDPWTNTTLSASPAVARLFGVIKRAVSGNADASGIDLAGAMTLLRGVVRFARPRSWPQYLSVALSSLRGAPWRRALFLDRLLADLFISLVRDTRAEFATLFLNAGAHIQHHYMYSSAAYSGPHTNPNWYVRTNNDPVFEVLDLYDRVVGDVINEFPEARIMIATGLHQDPHCDLSFYWRLTDHAGFLKKHRISFERVDPLMSRDFLITFRSADQALKAARILGAMVSGDGRPLFEVDNRGSTLFVMLVYPADIPADFRYYVDGQEHRGLRSDVAFVAIKNGQHNGIGYFLDTGAGASAPAEIPLADLAAIVRCAVLGNPQNITACVS